MIKDSPILAHGELKEIFSDIFFVMGSNVTIHEGVKLQHSCNMVIVKSGNKLTLINTIRLSYKGLAMLDNLGKVTNIVRICAFHGKHDAFYVNRYSAKLWALKGMQDENNKKTDIDLTPNGKMPFPGCSLFVFETSAHPEGILHINREGGILITCDSIKNWTYSDEFFSKQTAKLYEDLGFFGSATISEIWQQTCNVQAQDFLKLKLLSFHHLFSAHGEPLINKAYEQLTATIKQKFGI